MTTIKVIIEYVKLILILLLDLLFRVQKFIKFLWFGKHEIQRICEAEEDIYEKASKVDLWLDRTNFVSIRKFLDQQFGYKSHLKPNSSVARKAINKILFDYRKNETQLFARPAKRKTRGKIKGSSQTISNNNTNYLNKLSNLEDGDIILNTVLRELTSELVKLIEKAKHLHDMSANDKECLRDIIYRIITYKITLMLGEQLASTKYDADLDTHTDKLISLWNNLVRADKLSDKTKPKAFPPELSYEINDKKDIVSNRWSHIGFQGEDPGTDFRGMGILGLTQLEYLSRRDKNLARDLLKRSLNEEHSYPLAIVGINVTYNLLCLYRDGSMKHLYYDTGDTLFRNKHRNLNLLKTFNNLYVELFLRFDCFWHEAKPENIFEFKSLMEKFVSIIKADLCSRDFSFKFIY